MPDLNALTNEVKGLPDQALQAELTHPSGLVPSYLVLAEAQRRELTRQAEQKQQAQGQSSSVYDDVIKTMMARLPPQGLPAPPAGMTPMGSGPQMTPGATPPQNFGTPKMMAKGGALRFADGGSNGDTQPTLQEQAALAYPGIADQLRQAAFRVSPAQTGDPRVLEFYEPGESDSFDPKRPAIEVFGGRARPIDVAGDLVSHYLNRGADPTVTKAYQDFEASLTPEQRNRFLDQYQWATQKEGETRPFVEWYRASGLPAYFRGYLFNQWPNPEKFYTPRQIQKFDALNQYLKRSPPAANHARGGFASMMAKGGALRFQQGGANDDDPSSAFNPTQAEADTLADVAQRESGGDYTLHTRLPKSSASGKYQFTNDTWRDTAKRTGVGLEYTRAMDAPPWMQEVNALNLLRTTRDPNSTAAWAASSRQHGMQPYANPYAPTVSQMRFGLNPSANLASKFEQAQIAARNASENAAQTAAGAPQVLPPVQESSTEPEEPPAKEEETPATQEEETPEASALPPKMTTGEFPVVPVAPATSVSGTPIPATPSQAVDPYAQSRMTLARLMQETDISKATIRQLQEEALQRYRNPSPWEYLGNLAAGMADSRQLSLPMAFAHGVGVAGNALGAERQKQLATYLALGNQADAIDKELLSTQMGWQKESFGNLLKQGVYGAANVPPGPGYTFTADPGNPAYGVWAPPAQMKVTPGMIPYLGEDPETGKPYQAGQLIPSQYAAQALAAEKAVAIKTEEKKGPPVEQKTLDYYVKQVQQDAANWALVPTEWKTSVGQELANKGVDVKRLDAATREMQIPQDPNLVSYWADQVQHDAKNLSMINNNKGLTQAVRTELANRGVNVAQLDATTRQTAVFAQTVQPHVTKISGLIDQLDKEGKLGPVMGRWNDFRTGKWGAGDPEYAELRNNINLLDSAVARIHGGVRGGGSPQMIEYMHSMLGAKNMDAPTLRAGLGVFNDWITQYAGMAPRAGAASNQPVSAEGGVTTQGVPKATKRFNPQTGKFEDIP